MELVKFNKTGGPVSIVITISSPDWSYEYASDATFKNNSGTVISPQNHVLGHPADLDNDVNSWEIRLVNSTSANANYITTIQWFQDASNLNTWTTGSVSVNANALEIKSNDVLLIRT